MMKKIYATLLIFSLVWLPLTAFAETPKVTEIKQGQQAPFNGILYNYQANAVLLASKEKGQLECSLQLKHSLAKETARCDMFTSVVKASLGATEKKYDAIIKIKNNEIDHLQKLTLESPNDYNHWFFTGGVIVGVTVSMGIFYAAVQTAK